MAKRSKVQILNGKKYTIQRVPSEELQDDTLQEDEICWGLCSDPLDKKRYIKIDESLKGKQELILYCHEFFHSIDYSKKEAYVDKVTEELGKALWEAGYRKVK